MICLSIDIDRHGVIGHMCIGVAMLSSFSDDKLLIIRCGDGRLCDGGLDLSFQMPVGEDLKENKNCYEGFKYIFFLTGVFISDRVRKRIEMLNYR